MLRRRLMMAKNDESGPIDLSMVLPSGDPAVEMSTANCYLIHKAGTYLFPLVYGNAIKNGQVNTYAFSPGGTTTSTYLSQFVNHAGIEITGPWITKSGTGINSGMGLVAASAELIWQDVKGLISSVAIEDDYVVFTVSKFAQGNAIIAVKDGSGTILWSWHIWATREKFNTTVAVNTGECIYHVARRPLGWVPEVGEKKGTCVSYQWGRKDPFRRQQSSELYAYRACYDINGNSVGYSYSGQYDTKNIQDGIKQPNMFFGKKQTPFVQKYCNLWNSQNENTGNVSVPHKKTIYDPCPVGFCVPTSNLFYYMTSNPANKTWDSYNKCIEWTCDGGTVFLPTKGYIDNTNASSYYSSSVNKGYIWSATANDSSSGRDIWFRETTFSSSSSYKSNALCIIPVEEQQ